MKKAIYIIAGLVILYLLLSRQSNVPAAIEWINSGFRSVWNALTGVQ